MKSSQHKEILFLLSCLMVTQVSSETAQAIWAGVAVIQLVFAIFYAFTGD